jgi:hypothetical protein
MVVVVKVVVLMVVEEVMVVVATFEGRSRCNRCRRRNQKTRLRDRHRHNHHPRHTEKEHRCTFPRTAAHRRSPPPGRARGCGRAEARTQSGPQSRAEQRVGTREGRC